MKLLLGNSLEVLRTLAPNSVDSICCDPPYGLSFMGKKWDYDVPSVELWREVFRVLKPGGHVLSFGGTRTYHRMVVNIEDAGFEIRDQIMWIYGSGFPKSHNVSKGIDKAAGAEREVLGVAGKSGSVRNAMAGDFAGGEYMSTAPATDLAKQWQGWGTALKPANEPIVLARKPLVGTVAANFEQFGTGGLNIDASRIGYDASEKIDFSKVQDGNIYGANGVYGKAEQKQTTPLFKENGRWPANIIFDEKAAAVLDLQTAEKLPTSRFFYVAKASKRERNAGLDECNHNECDHVCTLEPKKTKQGNRLGSPDMSGKFPDHDHRPSGGNNHPTVKPVKLMEYLVRLVTPPGGVCLDPFMGSGTTGVACRNLGFDFIGVELSPEYLEIAKARIGSDDEAAS